MVNASAIVSGISANISAKSVSGDITLDGVTGAVDAKTVSGDLEGRDIDGEIAFNSVSGGLTLAGGSVRNLAAKTVSGQVTADIDLDDGGGLKITTVSGDVSVRVPGLGQRPGRPAVHLGPGAQQLRRAERRRPGRDPRS